MTRFETLEPDWLPVGEAVKRVLRDAAPLPEEKVALDRAGGRVLARDLPARVTLPAWDNSAMDGYAVRGKDVAGAAEDAPVELTVSGVVRAGDPPAEAVKAGTAVRIMTGAPVPPGADSIIRVEDTDGEEVEGQVRIHSDRDRERHIRPAGRDASAGDTILRKGTTIASGPVAALASQGYERVPVHRAPTVALLPNGDELAPLGAFEAVQEGRAVPESNSPALAAAARAAGATPLPLGIARDEPESILERLDRAGEADLLVTIGGASMGEADLLKRVLAERGYEVDFWRVRIRPGSPFSLGFLPGDGDRLPVFGLPGNPASAYVTFQVLVRPYLLSLAGHRRVHRPVVRARASEELRSPDRLTHFFRVVLEPSTPQDPPRCRPSGPQSSGLVRSLAGADGLAVVPEGTERIGEDEEVTVILLGEGPGWREDPGY